MVKAAYSTPIVDALNRRIEGVLLYCTPSIIKQKQVDDIFKKDISVSDESLGTLCGNTGVFKEAHDLASEVYKSDNTRFVVHGNTGSNYIVIRYLANSFKNCKMLCSRNIHKSVFHACEDFRVRMSFMDYEFDNEFEMFIPPSPAMIKSALNNNPDTNVVMLSNPTYEGLSCRLDEIVDVIRDFNKNIIIYVDEAWGAHFIFHRNLPRTAMECGADISTQSTHKQGGSLQQTSMLHWKNNRVNLEKMIESYNSYNTTSPSYHLLASLDSARAAMCEIGEKELSKCIGYADNLKQYLKAKTKLRLFEDVKDKWEGYLADEYDMTKIAISLSNYECNGECINQALRSRSVISEKYGLNSLLFLVTFQLVNNYEQNFSRTKQVIDDVLETKQLMDSKKMLHFPKTHNYRVSAKRVKRVKIDDCVGQIAMEQVIPYPPGIPLIIRGDYITKDMLEYYKRIQEEKIHIIKESPIGELNIC